MKTKQLNKFKERGQLRNRLLNELYEHHFSQGTYKIIDNPRDNLEILLAYRYLIDKELISNSLNGNAQWKVWITAKGIDFVESNLENCG